MLTIAYWVTKMTSSEISVYIGEDNELMFNLLPTLPMIYLMIEFPFNMIPIDWPMLIFVELLFSLMVLLNFLAVTITTGKSNIYDFFDWYANPFLAFASLVGCYVIIAVIFTCFWALTNKWKLPRYNDKNERRYTHMESVLGSDQRTLDEENPLSRSSI